MVRGKGGGDRSVEKVTSGSQLESYQALQALGLHIEADGGILRSSCSRGQPGIYLMVEKLHVAAPAEVEDKAKGTFEATRTVAAPFFPETATQVVPRKSLRTSPTSPDGASTCNGICSASSNAPTVILSSSCRKSGTLVRAPASTEVATAAALRRGWKACPPG